MGYNPSRSGKGGHYPVERVSWNHAQQFIRRLNQMARARFRLPTEAEWEFAARSGGKREKYAGGSNVGDLAWYRANSGSSSHPVGQKAPNGLGLHDMSGNVWEWSQDWYDSDYYTREKSEPVWNPQGPDIGDSRVLRGGGWGGVFQGCRAAIRYSNAPDNRDSYLGFRLARSVALGP